MEDIDLNNILYYYSQMLGKNTEIDDDIILLSKIYEILGKKLEKFDKKDESKTKYFINKLIEITIKIRDSLNIEDKAYFLRRLPYFVKISIYENDDDKIFELENIIPAAQELVIESLKYSDDEKIGLLNKIKEDSIKILIIRTIKNDNKKIELLKEFTEEYDRAYIVASIKDDEKKLEFYKEFTDEGLKTLIIESLKNDEFKISLLKEIKDEKNKVSIISSLYDDTKKIELLENVEDEKSKIEIIKSINLEKLTDENKAIIFSKIEDEKEKVLILKSIKDDDKKTSLLKNIKEENNITSVIISLKDEDKKISLLKSVNFELYKACIICSIDNDDKKIENLKDILEEEYRSMIICSMENDNKKINLLKNIVDENNKIDIIRSIKNIDKRIQTLDYLKEENSKKRVIIEIRDNKKRMKALGKVNEDFYKAYILSIGKEETDIRGKYKKINLPSNMTIGIEIETMGNNNILFPEKIRNWECKPDYSLGKKGVECISPILHDKEEDVYEIYRMNEIIKLLGTGITPRCGGHVHIGADYITKEEGFKELIELWGNAEEIYYLISNKPKELPRKGVREFAIPISEIIEESEIEDIPQDSFILNAKEILNNNRYRSINLMNVNNSKNTIEFRVSNGTLDGDIWIENILLYGRTVQIAEELGKTVRKLKEGEELTEEEKRKYALKEMLKDDIPLDAKMNILMQILFSEEEREIYYKRYKENKELNNTIHIIENFRFGKVDFRKIYNGLQIPEELLRKMKEEEKIEDREEER